MSDSQKQPLYKWAARPFWTVIAPLLLIVWGVVIYFDVSERERVETRDIIVSLAVLVVLFGTVALIRTILRKKHGLE